ncbi:TPA: hypothetical protein ACH3X1_000253 [Trebouxia sp. C0004]
MSIIMLQKLPHICVVMHLIDGSNRATCQCHQTLTLSSFLPLFSNVLSSLLIVLISAYKARRELPLLRQEGQSAETYAAKFNNMSNRITEGTAIDSTTLAFPARPRSQDFICVGQFPDHCNHAKSCIGHGCC